jgi:predicted DNA-binding transcriptional regulator AlpA
MAHWTEFLDPRAPDGRYLRWREVEARVGISRTTAWRLQKIGAFPAPYVISPRRVGYRENEVEAWKASRRHRGELAAEPEPAPALPPPITRTVEAEDGGAKRSVSLTPSGAQGRIGAAASAAPPSRVPRAKGSSDGQRTFDF